MMDSGSNLLWYCISCHARVMVFPLEGISRLGSLYIGLCNQKVPERDTGTFGLIFSTHIIKNRAWKVESVQ